MKFLNASDVFESSKICYYVSKCCCFYFATYEKVKNGFYQSRTRFCDVLLYFAYMIFGLYWSLDLIRTPTVFTKSRSIVLEIIIDLKCKIQLTQPFITLTTAFWYRPNILKILQKLNKIDETVRIWNSLNAFT